jgi:predicted secreted protein
MVQSLRVLAVVALMVFAAVGCQKKGTQSAAKGEAESSAASAESSAASTASNGGETQAEAGKSSTEPGTSTDSHTAAASSGAPHAVKGSTLTELDDGALVDLHVGQVLTVVLDSNHDAGLSWTMAKPTAAVIVPEGKPVYAAKAAKSVTDATGTETWHFRAAKPGEQTVRLEYQRGMGQSVAERRFGFTATVR